MRELLIKSSILCHESAADGLFNREIKAVQAEYEKWTVYGERIVSVKVYHLSR